MRTFKIFCFQNLYRFKLLFKNLVYLWFKSFANSALLCSNEISKVTVLKCFGICKNISINSVSNPVCALVQNIFCWKSLFEKVYKMIWLQNLHFKGSNDFENHFKKSFEKQKPFYKSFDFIKRKIYLKRFQNQTFLS